MHRRALFSTLAGAALVPLAGVTAAFAQGKGGGGGNGKGGGNNGKGKGNGGGTAGGAPLPFLGVTLAGQAAAAAGLYWLHRRRAAKGGQK
jgi:hypothetical protein